MNIKRKFTLLAFLTSAAVVGMLSLNPAEKAQAQPNSGAIPLTGWLSGRLDVDPQNPNARAWIAEAAFSINDEVLSATIIDRAVAGGRSHVNNGGGWSGTELWSVTFQDGSTFEVEATYNASPSSAPGLYTLHETGKLVNGTGRFQNASGELSIQGPFVAPKKAGIAGVPRWISEIHGSIVVH